MNNFIKLCNMCKCSVRITVNDHLDCYETFEYAIKEINEYEVQCGGDPLSKETEINMIEHKQIVCLQFYPRSPVSFYQIYHWDIEEAINEALKTMEELND